MVMLIHLTLFFLNLIFANTSAFNLFGRNTPKLGKYNVDANDVTVSGISSGGAMAVQVHYAHSKTIKGSGVFAGGPFACAYGNPLNAASCMEIPELINVQTLIGKTDKLSSDGLIDPTANINGSKVYIFHGKNDIVVRQGGGKHVESQYKHYGANVLSKFDSEANHGQPVDGNGWGGPCAFLNVLQTFINECAYNGAYEMLNWIYGQSGQNLIRPEKGFVADGKIVKFDQNEFFAQTSLLPTSMASSGFLYVPKNCANGTTQCKLHVAFHGCAANEQLIGTDYATKSQYDEVAEKNNIVILYPQTSISVVNPSACWDWIGYTGMTNYLTKSGVQISGVKKMIERVISG